MTTTTAQVTYRKTQAGEWVVCGPTHTVRAGATVNVTKRDGTTKAEHIASVGRSFVANGEQMVYGYITKTATNTNHAPRRGRPGSGRCTDCGGQLSSWEIRDYGTVCHDCF